MFRQVALLLVLVTLSAAASRRRPTNPDLGQDQEKFHNLFTQIFGSSYYSSLTYSDQYRPPSVSDDSGLDGPDPTIVLISLKNLQVTQFNETDQSLTFNADLLREYSDNRLVFDAPQGLKYVDASTQSLWTPGLVFSKTSVKPLENYNVLASSWNSKETLLSPEGQVLIKLPVTITVKTNDESAPLAEKEFNIDISSDKWTTEDVELAWSKENAVDVTEHLHVNGLLGTYKVVPTLKRCKRSENLGSFVGVRDFSCIQLNIKLVMQTEKLYRITI